MDDWEAAYRKKAGGIASIKVIKTGRYYERLLDAGLTPGTQEWRNGHERLRLQERNTLLTRQERDIANEKRKKRYRDNAQKERKANRERKTAERLRRSDAINANQRACYAKDRELAARKQCARRHVREPHRAIRAATELYCQGLLTDKQYNERINDCIGRAKLLLNNEGESSQDTEGSGDGTGGGSVPDQAKRTRAS